MTVDIVTASLWIYPAIVVLVVTDVYLPVLPSGGLVATAAVYALGDLTALIALLCCAAGASWAGDVIGRRLFRSWRAGRGPRSAIGKRIAEVDQRVRQSLLRRPLSATVAARFLPAGRTAVAWVTASAPSFRHGLFSAVAGVVWALYTVCVGLLAGWIIGPGLISLATAVTALAVVSALVAWQTRSDRRAAAG